jgi:hypothetical protein
MANTRPSIKLQNNPYSSPSFIYPADLGTPGQEPYMIFDIRHSVARQGQRQGTIAMYMPASLKVTYRNNYEEGTVELTETLKKAKEAYDSGNWTEAAGVVGRGLSKQLRRWATPIEELKHTKGLLFNPHMAVMYKGVAFRTFHFEFHLMARSAEESALIRNIIYWFKYAAHPTDAIGGTGEGDDVANMWEYPDNFIIGLFSPSDEYLFRISTCVLEQIDVDYAGSGIPSFFEDTGAPVDIRLNLDFKETEVMTKQRLIEGF